VEPLLELLLNLGVPLILIIVALITGSTIEKRHFRSIHHRELALENKPVLSSKAFPEDRPIARARLVTGTVVISYDYFKRFLAGLRLIFGGEVKSYVGLIDRGRREAILRLREKHPDADLIVNLRIETSSISKGRRKRGIGTVEVIAYGTALWYANSQPHENPF
jgi:uncharacterized protein YbjQ (UPF0145 family)